MPRGYEYSDEDDHYSSDGECANPLFLEWVQEFHAEKDYRRRGGPPRATGYEMAITAIRNCTEKYDHPRYLLKLSGVGPTTVSRLEEKLEEYCEEEGLPMPEYVKPTRGRKKAASAEKDGEQKPAKKPVARKRKSTEIDDAEDYPPPKKSAARRRGKLNAIEADETYPPPRPGKIRPEFMPKRAAFPSGIPTLEEMYPMVKITKVGPVTFSDVDEYSEEEKPKRKRRLTAKAGSSD
ncbi:unnamed protein product [Peniophora sp. CBMAI 1063]|nr:unnamed protein product [Peniophora sp. CBMAI 1063]